MSSMPQVKMTQLARRFPQFALPAGTKCDVHGVDPFDAAFLARSCRGWSHGEVCVVQFLVTLYDPGAEDWPCGRFDVMEALAVWDTPNREVFTAWVEAPWWP